MTKAEIIEQIYEKVGFSKKESAEIVELVFDTMKETLEKGEKIKISGFWKFCRSSEKAAYWKKSSNWRGNRNFST